jgi:hypothetical protein
MSVLVIVRDDSLKSQELSKKTLKITVPLPECLLSSSHKEFPSDFKTPYACIDCYCLPSQVAKSFACRSPVVLWQ